MKIQKNNVTKIYDSKLIFISESVQPKINTKGQEKKLEAFIFYFNIL